MIKDVLVHVDATAAGGRRLDYAFDLAERHGARLTGIHVTPPVDVPPYYKPSAIDRVAEALAEHNRWDAAGSEALFAHRRATTSVQTHWQLLDGDMARRVCEEAQSADLVVLGQYEHEGSAEHRPLSLADEVVSRCGRPVVVVPDQGRQVGRALRGPDRLGWQPRGRARVHDALPLLRAAGATVEIVTLEEGAPPGSVSPLIDHLARHGLQGFGSRRLEARGSGGVALSEQLKAGDFDLLVMGAYGRPAWIEFLFGGTTKSALLNATTPVLISH